MPKRGSGKRAPARRTKLATCSIACAALSLISSTAFEISGQIARRVLAGPAICGMEGLLRDAAHVVSDRGENSPGAESVDEPFVARHALCDFAWPNDVTDSARVAHVRDSVRLHRP